MTERRCLPHRRHTIRYALRIAQQSLYLDIGFYSDDTVGEIWVTLNKVGTTVRDLLRAWAIEFSHALQRGATLEERVRASLGTRFEPEGEVQGHPLIRWAGSIQDLVARVLAVDWLCWQSPDGRMEPVPLASTNAVIMTALPEPAADTVFNVLNPRSIDTRIQGSGA